MIKLGLLGLGTVGSGVYEIVTEKQEMLKKATGENIEIGKILVRDKSKKRDLEIKEGVLTENIDEILDNPEIDVVVEVMGGIDEAYDSMVRALKNGKHVVTANKAVISLHIEELHKLALENNCGLLYEASVAGGIPIIKNLKEMLKINNVGEIKGILNGTTNFILTKMYDEDLSFDEALALAHKYGYAEADPTDDVEGYDAARKISIMASLAYGTHASINDVVCYGITSIRTIDVVEFKKMGLVPKLLGCAVREKDKYSAIVEPILVEESSMFSSVKDAFNMVSVIGDTVGELEFYGQGAGKNPTGNAVVMDIIDIVLKNYEEFSFEVDSSLKPDKGNLFKGLHYLRVSVDKEEDKDSLIEKLKSTGISCKYKVLERDLVIVTEKISSNRIEKLVKEDLGLAKKTFAYLRIESNKLQSIEQLNI
jgi:homoserine dehydrogenase